MFRLVASIVAVLVILGGYVLVNGVDFGSTVSSNTSPAKRASPPNDAAYRNLKF